MPKDTTAKIDLKDFESVLKALKEEGITINVGVLPEKDARSDGKSNSEVGAAHEYGNPAEGLPIRSFLRIPLSQNLKPKMENQKVDQAVLQEVVHEKSMMPFAEMLGELAVEVVLDAFKNQGPGWAPHASGYQNKTGMILQDTIELKNSISAEVKKK